MQNSQEWFAYRLPAIGEKAVCLSSHPLLLGSCLEELAAAVAGCPLEGRDVGDATMVAVHDGWQHGEEGWRPRGLLQAAVDVWHIGARQAGDATLGVEVRVANVAEPWWSWRLGARGHGEAWWCCCCHLAAPIRINVRAMPSFFLRVEEAPAGASHPTHRMEVARLMEIGLQHEQHSDHWSPVKVVTVKYASIANVAWDAAVNSHGNGSREIKGSPSYKKSVLTFLPLASLFSLSALARARRRRRMPSYCFGFT
jgi:hypothetical protein